MLIQSEEPVVAVRVGVSPWSEEERTWYRVEVSKKVTPCKDCHLARPVVVPYRSAHL